eukprot:TRINITY_DN19957_c0_g1_i1.p1 TRINITY_DN19957_c0_g1~~TRINITY_DN19957_c0_g1_i1.p1  ORF type:complete len:882 (+),score=242.94 TRINITY_DN19957_c0_g1_i1:86-2647(+)
MGDAVKAATGTVDASSFVAYLRKHGVSLLMEDMLRDLATERPDDPEVMLLQRMTERARERGILPAASGSPQSQLSPPVPPGPSLPAPAVGPQPGAQGEAASQQSGSADAGVGINVLSDAFAAEGAEKRVANLSGLGQRRNTDDTAGQLTPRGGKAARSPQTHAGILTVLEGTTVLANLGPVVGKVTATSAVVLLEVDTECEMSCVATPVERDRSTVAGVPKVESVAASAGPGDKKETEREDSAPTRVESMQVDAASPKASGDSKMLSPTLSALTPMGPAGPPERKHHRRVPAGVPFVFQLTDLAPETLYKVDFRGISAEQRSLFDRHGGCTFKTLPDIVEGKAGRLNVIALSCDRPNRLMADEGEVNPWESVAEACATGKCDLVIHCGDQVYTCMNDHLEWCYRYYELMERADTDAMKEKLRQKSIGRLRDAYRDTWTFPGVRRALAHASHLMLWSDNDVANDFTVLKSAHDPQKQAYPAGLLRCAMEVYREYQRQLWDTDLGELSDPVEEWHFHVYGRVGVFMIDMRGSRINAKGEQLTGPILTPAQRKAMEDAFKDPQLSCMLVCSEIPYVGDSPEIIHKKAEKFVFLEDHWPYHVEELKWLLDLCFDWRSAKEGREVALIGGDIHVGVESAIKDSKTGATIMCITTSPITNHVCGFFPDLSGKIGDRYSYEHKVLKKKRNYCTLDIRWDAEGRCTMDIELVAFHTLASIEDERKKQGVTEQHRHKGAQLQVGPEGKKPTGDWMDDMMFVPPSMMTGLTSPAAGNRRRSSCPAASRSFVKQGAKWFGGAGKGPSLMGSDWFAVRQPVMDTASSPVRPKGSGFGSFQSGKAGSPSASPSPANPAGADAPEGR